MLSLQQYFAQTGDPGGRRLHFKGVWGGRSPQQPVLVQCWTRLCDSCQKVRQLTDFDAKHLQHVKYDDRASRCRQCASNANTVWCNRCEGYYNRQRDVQPCSMTLIWLVVQVQEK